MRFCSKIRLSLFYVFASLLSFSEVGVAIHIIMKIAKVLLRNFLSVLNLREWIATLSPLHGLPGIALATPGVCCSQRRATGALFRNNRGQSSGLVELL